MIAPKKPSVLERVRAFFPRPVRLYVYGVGAAVVVLLAALKVVPVSAAPLALPMLLALLNLAPKDPK